MVYIHCRHRTYTVGIVGVHLHLNMLSLCCSTLLYKSLRYATQIFGVAASGGPATLHDCTLVYDTHDTVRYRTALYATVSGVDL